MPAPICAAPFAILILLISTGMAGAMVNTPVLLLPLIVSVCTPGPLITTSLLIVSRLLKLIVPVRPDVKLMELSQPAAAIASRSEQSAASHEPSFVSASLFTTSTIGCVAVGVGVWAISLGASYAPI